MKLLRHLGVLFVLALLPMAANAKGIPLFFNTGDELFEVAPLPQELADEYPSEVKLGYHCQHFGVFWADAWTWDCNLAAVDVKGKSYGDLPDEFHESLSAKYSMSDAKRGFWNHYGLASIAGVIGLLLLLSAVRRKT